MIVGQMALCRFPLWDKCLKNLADNVDALYLRFDGITGDRTILDRVNEVAGAKLQRVMVSKTKWDGGNWREEMLRMLDLVRPSIVLSIDEDEMFGDGIEKDIFRLRNSKKNQMAFKYLWPMPSVDGIMPRNKPLPSKPHVKAYKWRPGLSYIPYMRRARVTGYKKNDYIIGKSMIAHYCFWNEELRSMKMEKTISAKKKMEWVNEVVASKGKCTEG